MGAVIKAGVVAGIAFAAARPGTLAAQVEVQAFLGSAASLPLAITVAQDNQPDVRFTAHWATNPSRPTRYYAVRVGFWKGNRGWRIDHTHHKMYLTNPPAEVQDFRITNGFNVFSFSRAFRRHHLTYSLGAGPVVTYPISRVRGLRLNEDLGVGGYHVNGGSVIAMATREVPIVAGLILSVDARASASYVRVPIARGHASVPNAALHLHFGLGYLFGRKR